MAALRERVQRLIARRMGATTRYVEEEEVVFFAESDRRRRAGSDSSSSSSSDGGGDDGDDNRESWKGDLLMYACVLLAVVIMTNWSPPAAPGSPPRNAHSDAGGRRKGPGAFTTSFVVGVGILATAQYRNNLRHRRVWGMPLALFIGVMAKMMSLMIDLVLFLAIDLLFIKLGNPHPQSSLTVPEVFLRIAVVALLFIGVTDECVRLGFLLTFDEPEPTTAAEAAASSGSPYSRLGAKLNLYHPHGVVLLSLALALGGSGLDVMSSLFITDHLIPWPYRMASALLEPFMNAACGVIVGVGLAERMFLRHLLTPRSAPHILAPAVALRAVWYSVIMLPLRCRSYSAEEREAKHIFHHITRILYDRKNELPAANIGHWLVLVYVGLAAITAGGCYYAYARKQEMDAAITDGVTHRGRREHVYDDGL